MPMGLNQLKGLMNAYLTIMGTAPMTIYFHFNPLQYSVSKQAEWSSSPQQGMTDGSMMQFQGNSNQTISVEVLLDASLNPLSDVSADVDALLSTCEPTAESVAADSPEPPHLLFGWGSNEPIDVFMQSVEVTHKLFRLTGTCTRAEVQLSMQKAPSELPATNPTSGGRLHRRSHRVVAGDTLASIAQRAYGSPRNWRLIAEANGIDDPTRLVAGSVLLVPDARGGGVR
jgi:hypothetical protein